MKLFRRAPASYEEKLRQEAGLTEASKTKTDRSMGTAALTNVNGTAELNLSPVNVEAEADDDPEFEAEISERILEIEAMSIDELLRDSADSIARAELGDDEDGEYYLTHAAAISTRALILQLRMNQIK